jgi:hypothetical protein
MVAGTTPTTVKAGFVSAVLEAGYHVELAGGGHYSLAALRAKVAEIQGKISPGIGLTLNSLYINPRQFSFQLPLWQDMCREGLPIEGCCVAAGIPTTEKAAEIIVVSSLLGSAMSHSSLVQWTAISPISTRSCYPYPYCTVHHDYRNTSTCIMNVLRVNQRPVRLSCTACTAPLVPSPSKATTPSTSSDQTPSAPGPAATSPPFLACFHSPTGTMRRARKAL